MYYLAAMNFTFVYTILGYSIAVFLQERFPDHPNAIFLVGLILGAASFFALFVDVFWGYLQSIKPSKPLFIWAIFGLMATVAIFLFSQFNIGLFQPFRWALFTIVAAFSYGWSFDLYDVTMTSYILKISPKEELSQNISQKKVAEAVGMLMGLIVGGVIIFFGSQVAQVFLLFFLFAAFLFVKQYFDRGQDNIPLKFSESSQVNWREVFRLLAHPDEVATVVDPAAEQLKQQVLQLSQETAGNIQNLPVAERKKAEALLENARRNLLELLMDAKEVHETAEAKKVFHFGTMMHEVGGLFKNFLQIFSRHTPFCIFWVMFIVMFFSFWDTMAVTFQPAFVARFTDKLGAYGGALSGLVMGLFILPVFAFQILFGKLADKYGKYIMIFLGIAVSGISLIFLGLIDTMFGGSIIALILLGMLNSAGYAAAFSPAQAMFVQEHQKNIFRQTGKMVDDEEGAAPLRLVLNFGNILGQLAGGFVFAFWGFTTGFMIFGVLLLGVAIFTLPFWRKLKSEPDPALEKLSAEHALT